MHGEPARGARVVAAALVTAALAAAVAGCGGGSGATTERQFAANAAGLIQQLHQDLALSMDDGSDLASARKALADVDDLYVLLQAFGDFGSCRQMVKNAGRAEARFDRVEATLGSACAYLERASQLFTDATTRSDARALLRAARTMLKASPLLYRAKVELDAASGRRR